MGEQVDDRVASLVEAHVRYEVDRWREEAVRDSVAEAVAAGFGWLGDVTLSGLVPPVIAQAWVVRVVMEAPLTDDLYREIERGVRAARECLLEASGPVTGLLPVQRYEQLVSSVVGLRRLREEVLVQVTESAVYAQLISHVLYHGLKDYLLTENALVRRVPGASSLLRMGQNAVRSATPSLEAGIDRRLVGFVAANVGQTVRDSREFLTATLDDAMLRTIAEEIWAVNSSRPVAQVAALVEEESLGDVVAAGREVWLAVRSSAVAGQVINAVVEAFYLAHGDQPVADLLGEVGVTRENASAAISGLAAPLVAVARDGGHLEAHVRRRLGAFYRGYFAMQQGQDAGS